MKIVSKFKDYYDYTLGWQNGDNELVYNRNTEYKGFFEHIPQSLKYSILNLFDVLHSDFEHLYQQYYTPVFAINVQGLMINPCLDDFKFGRIVEGYQAFQRIEQFLLAYLSSPKYLTHQYQILQIWKDTVLIKKFHSENALRSNLSLFSCQFLNYQFLCVKRSIFVFL